MMAEDNEDDFLIIHLYRDFGMRALIIFSEHSFMDAFTLTLSFFDNSACRS